VLKLKRVELQGFKSFCDRSELRFNGGGIAGVVGPNGCGKSNLSDAISWVLGEQSAKSLRGSRMEDVIFAGTRDRKPLGMASVTMTLVDPAVHDLTAAHPLKTANGSNGTNGTNGANGTNGHGGPTNGIAKLVRAEHLAPDTGEVVVTRRLFRSGESEYLINGRSARLRDIQDIFMGTGLGPESYAIIEQGRIGQLLSSKPQDRRNVIEEAAGISKYKSRRRLAEAKLEGAKQNLARVFDILEEVTRQMNSLKRQAAKARRFEELKKDLNEQLRKALTGKYRVLERDAAKTALDLNQASATLHSLADEVAGKEREHAETQAQCYDTESRLTAARKQAADCKLESERTRSRLEYQAKQIGTIEQRLAQGETDSQEIEGRLARLAEEASEHLAHVKELEAAAEAARARLAAKSEEREKLQALLRDREGAVERARRDVLRLLGEASTLRNQLAQIDEYLAGIDRESARVEKENQTATADQQRLNGARQELSGKLAARQLEMQSIGEQRATVEERLADARTGVAEERQRLEQVRSENSRLKARKDSLEEILSHRAYTTESVKQLFNAVEQGQAQGFRPLGVLADFVEVDSAYERAAEEFLHDELEFVVVEGWDAAERGIELMRSDLKGRATFLAHQDSASEAAGEPAAIPELGPEDGVIGRLTSHLRLNNGFSKSAPHWLPRLTHCFLTEDRGAAQRLAPLYPDAYFLLPDGVCYQGNSVSGGRKEGSGPLVLKRELRELTVTVQSKQKELDATALLVANLDEEIAALQAELERLRGVQQNQEKEALALDHEMRKLAEDLSKTASRLSVARLELDRLRQERERALTQKERNQQAVAAKERERLDHEMAMEAAREELDRINEDTAQILEAHSALRVEMAGVEERRRAEQAAHLRADTEWKQLSKRSQDLAAAMERMGVERARLLSDNIELDAKAATLAVSMEEAESTVEQLALAEGGQRLALAAGEEALKALRVRMQEAQEERSRIEVDLVRRQAELKFLDETSRKELDAPIEQIAQAEETVLDEEGLAAAEQKYQEIKARIEGLGPVNPQALEEFRETEQRHEFLNTQRQDLIDSIRDTEKAIHDIDVESRRKFSEAFEAINANFRAMFHTLFGGGVGEMRLTDETNVNDSGIDIVASPPGKRLQNVLLLSGGEKALTALALLMAVFKYQPSPFCILDEVDAPLDDANIGRFMRLVTQMSENTQFIIITHSRKTMAVAQTLYGVTMQEPGVSKLVSVKFQPVLPPPPVAPETMAAPPM
jgi:chromosome segregation protein